MVSSVMPFHLSFSISDLYGVPAKTLCSVIYLFIFSLKHSWFKSYGHPIINQKSHKVTGIGCFQKRQQHSSLKWVFLFLSNNHRLKENGFIPFLELVVFHTQKKNQDFDIQENGFLFLFLYFIYIYIYSFSCFDVFFGKMDDSFEKGLSKSRQRSVKHQQDWKRLRKKFIN